MDNYISYRMSWDSDLGLCMELCKKIFLVSLELKPDHCRVLLSLWGKQMSESPSHRTWEEHKKTLLFMSYTLLVQNSMGKDFIWASMKLLITMVGPRQKSVSL